MIPGFRLMIKPLYEATKGPDTETFLWTRKQEMFIISNRPSPELLWVFPIKKKKKSFFLHLAKKQGAAPRILI